MLLYAQPGIRWRYRGRFDIDATVRIFLTRLADEVNVGIPVQALFAEVDLLPSTPLPWRNPVPWDVPGVYVLSLSSGPQTGSGLPRPDNLPPEIGARWLSDQPIIYIGKAGGERYKATLQTRLRQFYRHRWGAGSPHNGGQDVHLLTCPVWIFVAPTPQPQRTETKMIAAFKAQIGHRPFANRSG